MVDKKSVRELFKAIEEQFNIDIVELDRYKEAANRRKYQSEIIENSTMNENGLYMMTIDNSLKIYAGDLEFMLDYPINIISKRTDKWSHTCHYDISVSNSLNNATGQRYISTKVISAFLSPDRV